MALMSATGKMSRFALQWLVPRQPELLTHVILLDKERPAPYVVMAGHGGDRLQALRNLWSMLIKHDAVAEAIDYVAAEYARRSGEAPAKSSG
jgi:hypothetical protein